MRFVFFFAALFALQAEASSLSIRPLYESESFTPTAYIPFKVESNEGKSVEILTAVLEPQTKDCGVILDRYRKDIFLVKCNIEYGGLRVELTTLEAGRGVIVKFGPLNVKVPFADVVVVPPEPPGVDPDLLVGQQLFSALCVNCHQPAVTKKGRTFNAIKNAINSQPTMNTPDLIALSDADIGKIVKYLGSLK